MSEQERRPPWRSIAIFVLMVVALNLVVALFSAARPRPRGPASSSYATSPRGLAAYAELLERSGFRVERLRRDADLAGLEPSGTLVVSGATPPRSDIRSIRSFVHDGGRLVVAGGDPELGPGWVDDLIGPTEWAHDAPRSWEAWVPVAETEGVGVITSAGEGGWIEAGENLPVVGGGSHDLLLVGGMGRGEVALLADASLLQNRLLGRADNALLGVGLAGKPPGPVWFLETVHGYGEAAGLGALPVRWRWALGFALLAALVWMLSRARRLGPPELESRLLPPPRRLYVESLAAVLARARAPDEAKEVLTAAAARRLVRRTGLRDNASDAEMTAAAERAGLSPPEIEALFGTARGEEGLVAAARGFTVLGDLR